MAMHYNDEFCELCDCLSEELNRCDDCGRLICPECCTESLPEQFFCQKCRTYKNARLFRHCVDLGGGEDNED